MIRRRYVSIGCDSNVCSATFLYEGTAPHVRYMATEQGWTQVGDLDFCPLHSRRVWNP